VDAWDGMDAWVRRRFRRGREFSDIRKHCCCVLNSSVLPHMPAIGPVALSHLPPSSHLPCPMSHLPHPISHLSSHISPIPDSYPPSPPHHHQSNLTTPQHTPYLALKTQISYEPSSLTHSLTRYDSCFSYYVLYIAKICS
jgi:hypothetical protein